ncbi:hypothetical protein [Polaribacter sp. IC073]|uniref:hypothetical protein n=1 Tax=Polaribacter sp. IC073 TaxID=2508540 RepID=UPI0011BE9C07|nr:hypothetical protein [Polaribacter sp. IC073]TXD48214.1 hypothetical protein ES045_07195 [Polaribacter sp. IC073]
MQNKDTFPKDRIDWINKLKGFGIIGVIFWHLSITKHTKLKVFSFFDKNTTSLLALQIIALIFIKLIIIKNTIGIGSVSYNIAFKPSHKYMPL